jgi:hypothetical protein
MIACAEGISSTQVEPRPAGSLEEAHGAEGNVRGFTSADTVGSSKTWPQKFSVMSPETLNGKPYSNCQYFTRAVRNTLRGLP